MNKHVPSNHQYLFTLEYNKNRNTAIVLKTNIEKLKLNLNLNNMENFFFRPKSIIVFYGFQNVV